MLRSFFILCLFLAACASEPAQTGILDQAPFRPLTDSIRQMPGNAGIYYRRGVLLYQSDEKGLALQDLRTAWTLDPREDYALSITTVMKEKSTDSAIRFLQEAVGRLPESIALQIGLARGYQQKGRMEEAGAIADSVLARYPGQVDALTLKSELVRESRKPGQAIGYLERAYSLVPSDPALAYELAFAYAEETHPKTITFTDSLIKAKAPELEKAYYVRGVYYANAGKHGDAIREFDNAIRSNYNFFDAYRDKGELQLSQKKYDDALRTFTKALSIKPDIAEFYYLSGKALEGKGKMPEAKESYLKAFGLDKSLSEAKSAADRI